MTQQKRPLVSFPKAKMGILPEKSLKRQMALVESRKPGQSEEWYLEKIIYDLTKDRK